MPKTIMLVDDDVDVLDTLKVALEHEGYKTIRVQNAENILETLKKKKPDLVLLDIMMPAITGWKVCSQIKTDSKYKDIPVVFLTGKSDDLSREMGLKGAQGFISKPFDPMAISQEIQRYL